MQPAALRHLRIKLRVSKALAHQSCALARPDAIFVHRSSPLFTARPELRHFFADGLPPLITGERQGKGVL